MRPHTAHHHMNGGPFEPHGEHREGDIFDGWFTGYSNRNATTARTILNMLNDATFGRRIQSVLATFTRSFRNAIRGVVLSDGRRATQVILNHSNHTGHFHMHISTNPCSGVTRS